MMLYRNGLFIKLALLSLLMAGLSAPALALKAPDDKNPDPNAYGTSPKGLTIRSDGSVYGWDLASNRWRWFPRTELVGYARGFSPRKVYWWGIPYGWYRPW